MSNLLIDKEDTLLNNIIWETVSNTAFDEKQQRNDDQLAQVGKQNLNETSDIEITSDGIQEWRIIEEYNARIIEHNLSHTIVECITSFNPKTIEVREFGRSPFDKLKSIYQNKPIIIQIFEKGIEQKLKLLEGVEDRIKDSDFEDHRYLEVIKDLDFSKIKNLSENNF